MSSQQRKILIKTALGKTPAQTVFTGGQLVNVYSGEILPNLWVAFVSDRIAYVGPPNQRLIGDESVVLDLQNRFMLPGFIDGHTHLDSILSVRSLAPYALAFGNTTAVTEVAMIANGFGEKGVDCFLEETGGLPLSVYVLAPPLVPPFPELESSRPFSPAYFDQLLNHDRCLGVGETYWPRIVSGEERALNQYARAEDRRKTREGHAAGAREGRLMAYAAAGTTSCHEATTSDETLERLRLGLAVMIREGYVRRELDAISSIAKQPLDLHNIMLVTDSADLGELSTLGGMNLLVKKAVALGFPPVAAVQMVTVNAARYFGLRDRGGLAPGHVADMVVSEDLEEFSCHQVWAKGRLVAKDGEPLIQLEPYVYPPETRQSIVCDPVDASAFELRAPGGGIAARVIRVVSETITREEQMVVPTRNGRVTADPRQDLLKAAVLNKSLRKSKPSVSLVQGLGLRSGAAATSLVWDTTNILVVGASDEEMALAVNELREMGGGVVVVKGQGVMARLPLPVCGLISAGPLQEVVRSMREVEDACRKLGSPMPRSILTLETIPFTGLPYLRPTDRGLADVRRGRLVPLWLRPGT